MTATHQSAQFTYIPHLCALALAIRVTLKDAPTAFLQHRQERWWVGVPQRYCENSGQGLVPQPANPPDYGCGPAPGIPRKWFWASDLICSPVFVDWVTDGVDVLHVHGNQVIPGATYEVDVVHIECQEEMAALPESTFSAPLVLTTPIWGDVVMDCGGCPCSRPQELVEMVDILAIINKFTNSLCAVIKGRADIDPNTPNWIVDIVDVQRATNAFSGDPYPFAGPVPCN